MQDSIDALRDRQKASANQSPVPTLAESRAAFVPGDRLDHATGTAEPTADCADGRFC
jgi:hypothetical protein